MTVDGSEWFQEHTRHFSIPRHSSWNRLDESDSILVLSHPETAEGTFRPNVVIRTSPAKGSIQQHSTWALAATLNTLESVHVISNDEWFRHSVPGRMQQFTYQRAGYVVAVNRWILLAGRQEIEITASYTVGQSLGMAPMAAYMVSNLQLEGIAA